MFSLNANKTGSHATSVELICLSIHYRYFSVCECCCTRSMLNLFRLLCLISMDGFRVVKLNEVIRQVDVIITCTGKLPFKAIPLMWDYIF